MRARAVGAHRGGEAAPRAVGRIAGQVGDAGRGGNRLIGDHDAIRAAKGGVTACDGHRGRLVAARAVGWGCTGRRRLSRGVAIAPWSAAQRLPAVSNARPAGSPMAELVMRTVGWIGLLAVAS